MGWFNKILSLVLLLFLCVCSIDFHTIVHNMVSELHGSCFLSISDSAAFCSWKPLLETCGSDLLRSVYLKACIPDLKTNPKSGFGVLGFVCSDLR
ncbi:hypothetical protein HanRHA438_Chr06g0282341 [Helianthus annuus]|nr:hypothetical protein HanRHA438_Chr06g0282341 [Helianthus annuus]